MRTTDVSRSSRQERAAWAFVSPILLGAALVLVVPTLGALLLSVTDFDIYALGNPTNLRFVGASNYVDLANTPLFWRAVANTLAFALFGAPAAIALSLFAAVLVHERTVRWKPLWRVLLFAPYVTTLVATALVWKYVLDADAGLLNRVLGRLGFTGVNWLGDASTSIPATLIFIVWKVFGYNMLVFVAALATAPSDLYDAARIDGAGRWMQFRHVTMPAIGPTLLLAAIVSIANFLQVFAEPYVMTHGGPAQSTVTVLYLMFEQGLAWWNLGLASAVAVILFAAILAVTAVQARVGKQKGWL